MFSLAFHEFRGSSEPTNLILARANMPDPPRRIFLAMGCFFPHEIATKETFSVLSSFACSFLYLLSLNVLGIFYLLQFLFFFFSLSLSFSIEFLWIFFHRTVWIALSVFFRRFISCHPLTFFCFSALSIPLRRLLQFSYVSLLFLLRLCSSLYSLRTFRSSLRLLFSNFHFPETLHAS